MNTVLLALLLPVLSFSFEKPPSPCAGMSCPLRVLEIAAGFEKAAPLEASSLPLLASGECHHLNDNYHAETIHHGVVLLDTQGDQAFLGGKFGFFFAENPYKNWDLAKAREELPARFEDNHRLELTEEFAFADLNPGKTPIWFYWIKKSGEKIFLMGHWGVYHRLLCEMDLHR